MTVCVVVKVWMRVIVRVERGETSIAVETAKAATTIATAIGARFLGELACIYTSNSPSNRSRDSPKGVSWYIFTRPEAESSCAKPYLLSRTTCRSTDFQSKSSSWASCDRSMGLEMAFRRFSRVLAPFILMKRWNISESNPKLSQRDFTLPRHMPPPLIIEETVRCIMRLHS